MSKPTSLRVLFRSTLALFGKRVFVASTTLKQLVNTHAAKVAILVLILTPVVTTVYSITRAGTSANNTALAVSPATLNFQARLLNSSGSLVPDGIYNVEFKIYNVTTGGTALWTETRLTTDPSNQQISVKNGYLSVYLGDKTALPTTIWNQQLYLTMNIGGTGGSPSWDGEMTPRIRLTSVPFAFRATVADSAETLSKNTGSFTGTVDFGTMTADRKFLLPDTSLATTASPGTICVYNGAASNCPAASGSAYYLQNDTVLQTQTNFHIQARDSATNGTIGGVISGAAAGQTVDLLQFRASDDSTVLAAVTAAGNLKVASSIDTTAAGTLNIGNSTATAVSIAKSGVTTTINGGLTVTEGATFSSTLGVTGLTSLNGGATIRGLTVDTATATDDRIAIAVNAGGAARFDGTITNADLTAARTWTLPNASGTFITTGNLTAINQVGTVTAGTWNGTSLADAYVDDSITISSAGSVDWTALTGYPAACAAGQAIVQLGDTITCSSFATGSSASYIQNQNASQQTTSNYWISGSGRADTSLLTPSLDVASAGTLSIGTGTATGVSISKSGATTTVNGALTVNQATTLNGNVTVASGKTLTVTAGTTYLNSDPSGTTTPTFIASSTVQNPTTSVSITRPGTAMSGDLAIVFLATSSGRTVTPPAGWTTVTKDTSTGSGFNLDGTMFYKTLTSSEPASWSFGISSFANTSATLVVYRNAVIGTTAVSHSSNPGASFSTPTITSSSGAVILSSWLIMSSTAGSGFGAATAVPDAAVTNRTGTITGSDAFARSTVGEQVLSSGGTTTARTVTASNSSNFDAVARTIEILGSTGGTDALVVSNSTSAANIAVFKDNTRNVFTLANDGVATFQNATDSTSAFSVQNAAGTSLFNIDTTNSIITAANLQTTSLTVNTATATDDQILLSVTAGGAGRFNGTITNADLTASRTWTLPDVSGTFLLLGPSAAEVDSSANASIYINDTGGGNLLQLQAGGADKLVVDNTGSVSVSAGNASSVTITSDLSGGARSAYPLIITQANNATNNNSTGLLQVNNSDTGSTSAPVMINQAATGITLQLTGGRGINFSSPTSDAQALNINSGITTGWGFGMNAASLTSGNGIQINGARTGSPLNAFTGNYITVNPSANNSATSGTVTDSGNFLNLTRANTQSGAGGTFAITGSLANLQSNCTQTAGTCTDSSNILSLNQQYANATGSVLKVQNSGSGSLIYGNTTGSGSLLQLQVSASDKFVVSNGGSVTAAGGYTFSGVATDITTGTNEDLTIDANGTGKTIVNDSLDIGASAGSGTTFTNNGATVASTLALTDFATGGAIGTAANTVDKYTAISVAQTTASQSLTVPSPTANTTYGRIIYLANIGTASFTLLGSTLNPGTTATLMWAHTNGADSWVFAGADGNGILNQNSVDQSANFRITGTGRANTALQAPLFDTATAVALGIGTSNATNITIGHNAGTLTVDGTNFDLSAAGVLTLIGGQTADITTQANQNLTVQANGTGTIVLNDTVTTAGTMTFSGVATDITTGTNEDLTVVANGTGTIVLNDTVTVAGTVTYSGAATDITTGTNEDLTIDANGTGKTVINDSTTIGASAGSGTTFTNNGSTVASTLALTNFATGGAIGTAAATVDIYTSVSVTQTTTGQTLTIPTPTASTTYGRILYLANIGTASFNLLSSTLNPGATATLMWAHTNGADSWVFAGADGTSINNQIAAAQNGDFWIQAGGSSTGIGRIDGKVLTPTVDTATGVTLNLGVTTATAISLGKVGVTTTNVGNLTVGASAGSGTLFVNNGATVNTALAVANDSDGGSLGGTPGTPLTAAQSVDIYTSFTVNQTTTGQTITLPSPTSTTAGRLIYIANIGTASFGLLGSTLNAGSTATLMWNGTAWTFAGADGTSINNQKTAGQNGDFWIQAGGSSTGIGRADGGLQAPSLDTSSAAALNIGTTSATNIAIGHNAGTVSIDGTNFDLSTAGVVTLAGGQTADITTANASTANGITIKPGNSTGSNVAGGALTLQGGAATLGNANGGGVVIAGGAGVGTGTQGLVSLSTSAFTTLGPLSFGADTNVNALSAGAVNLYSSITASATVSGKTLTINAPTITTVGRLLYVANVGSNDFNILLSGTAVSISLKPNTTATLIWNGAGWTAAGASSSTDLQAAYNNTLTSAGGAELVLNAPGGAADGLTIRNNATTPIVGGLLEVQTSVGSNIVSVNNNATEYAANGGAETAGGSTTTFPASTWTASPTGGTQATISRTITTGEFATGIAATKVVTTGATTANQGVADQIAVNGTNTALTANLTYTVSFTVKTNSNFNTLDVVYSKDGTNTATTACKTGATATESIWSRISCTFTAPSSGITTSNAIFIRQSNSNSAARTFFVDNLSVNVNANTNLAADGSGDVAANIGAGTLNWGPVNTATVAQSTSTLYDTAGSVSVTTAATAGRGVYNKLSNNIVPSNSTQYRVSFFAKGNNTANLSVGYTPDNGTTNIACQDYNAQAINASSWTLISCYFTTNTASVTNAQVRITQTSGAATIFYVDALNVNLNNNNANNVQIGGANLGGPTTLLTLDRSSSAPIAANNDAYLGSMYYDTTTGRIQCYEADGWGACGSSPDNIITLTPEYPGAVLGGPGNVMGGGAQTPGIGVMTSEFCSSETGVLVVGTLCANHEARNYYHWTSPQTSQQIYSIYVVYKLPTTFKSFNDSNTIKLTAYSDSLTNGIATLQVFRKNAAGSAISACGTTAQTINTSTGTWQQTPYDSADETTCGFSGGDNIIFKIDMKSQSNGNIYVENLDFVYTNN